MNTVDDEDEVAEAVTLAGDGTETIFHEVILTAKFKMSSIIKFIYNLPAPFVEKFHSGPGLPHPSPFLALTLAM